MHDNFKETVAVWMLVGIMSVVSVMIVTTRFPNVAMMGMGILFTQSLFIIRYLLSDRRQEYPEVKRSMFSMQKSR